MAGQDAKRLLLVVDANIEAARRGLAAAASDVDAFRLRAERGLDGAAAATGKLDAHIGTLRASLSGLAGIVATVGIGALAAGMIGLGREAGTMRAQLIQATGSVDGAASAFASLEKFAARTPYTLDDAVRGFVKLKNLGLDPSEAALESYGNTAGATGKSLMDFVEAVADAATGEFERLKEFGIRASKQGDEVAFTFQGITTRVRNNAADIEGYLQSIGNNQFAGGMALQAKELGGALSNLQDNAAATARAFGEGGFTAAVIAAVQGMNDGAGASKDLAFQLGGLAGDAITAGGEVLGAFDGVGAGAVELVQDVRGTFSGFASVFEPLVLDARSAFGTIGVEFRTLRADIVSFLGTLDAVANNPTARKLSANLNAISSGNLSTFLPGRDAPARFYPKRSDMAGDFARSYDAKRQTIATEAAMRSLQPAFAIRRGEGGEIVGFGPDPRGLGAYGLRSGGGGGSVGGGSSGGRRARVGGGRGVRELSANDLRMGLDLPPVDIPIELQSESALAELDRLLGSVGDLKVAAVDLSTVEIIDPEGIEDARQRFESLNADIARGLTDVLTIGGSVGDVLVDSFARAGIAWLESGIAELLNGDGGGKLGGLINTVGGFLGIGGTRANGGPVARGVPYLVGEMGRPEIFVPDAPGNIVPLSRVGGGAPVQHFHVNAQGAVLAAGLIAEMQAVGANAAVAGAQGGARIATVNGQRQARQGMD